MVEFAAADGVADFPAGEHKRAVPWIAGPLVAHHGDGLRCRAFGRGCLGDLAVCPLFEIGGDPHNALVSAGDSDSTGH